MSIRNRVRELRNVKASALIANNENWRTHSPKQERAMAAVLEEVGYAGALLAREREDGSLVLIDGHLRRSITPEEEVPVLVLDVTEEEARLLLLTYDPISAMAEADRDKLRTLLDTVKAEREDTIELVNRIAKANKLKPPEDKPKDGLVGDEHVPEVPAEAVSKAGSLWRCGRHLVLCGDCKSPEAVSRLFGDDKVLLVLTDPPYCSGGFQESQKKAGTWGDIAADNLSTRGYQALIRGALEAARTNTAYIFTDWRMWIPLFEVVESCSLACRSMIVWDKQHPGLGGAIWRQQHELLMFASRSGGVKIKGEGGAGNVLRFGRTRNELHPTQKPVDLLVHILKQDERSARAKCPVLDPFAGSGSTLIACEKIGRACRAIEIEPRYVDTIVRRWEDFTGEKAEMVE